MNGSSRASEPPRCGYCGEETMVEVFGFTVHCDACGKTSALPPKVEGDRASSRERRLPRPTDG